MCRYGPHRPVEPHPLLEIGAFVTRFAQPLARARHTAASSAARADRPRTARRPPTTVRAEVRHSCATVASSRRAAASPPSDTCVAAAAEGRFPRINAAVDACNVASLCSGLPISPVDLDRLRGALTDRVLPAGTSYVFNPSGQVIDAGGLLAPVRRRRADRHPGQGRAAHEDPRRHPRGDLDRVGHDARCRAGRRSDAWYRELLAMIPGAVIEDVAVRAAL